MQQVPQVLHSQGNSVHFVQSVLFAAVHDRKLLPDRSFAKHFPS